jgi:hypothetical protein
MYEPAALRKTTEGVFMSAMHDVQHVSVFIGRFTSASAVVCWRPRIDFWQVSVYFVVD